MELAFADDKRAKELDCSTCPANVQKLRRCREGREDFTSKDGAFWPMVVNKGGEQYGFCPGKATWDPLIKLQFDQFVVMAEMKCLPMDGGLNAQPAEVISTLAWFLPKYDFMKFHRKADMIMGSSNDKTGTKPQSGQAPVKRPPTARRR